MKQKSTKKCIMMVVVLFLIVCGFLGTRQAIAATRQLQKIEAYYMGDALEIGSAINMKDVYIMAEYKMTDSYGSYSDYEDVKSGFRLSPSVVTKAGENQIVVNYNNKTAVIYVEGKTIEYIIAEYTGDELYVGSKIPVQKFEVYVYFNDGTYKRVKDFTLSSSVVEREGLNTVQVSYGGKIADTYIYGKPPLAVEEIIAYYVGDAIIEGNLIDKSKVEVTVIYNDGTTKEVSNFNLSPSIVMSEGENEIKVTYGGVSTTMEIYGLERYIVAMQAIYIGTGVEVGEVVDKDDIEVKVTYNDGSLEIIDEFSVYGETIWAEGQNTVIVYVDDFMEEVLVYGVEGFNADFSSSISDTFLGNDGSFSDVTLAVSWGLEVDKFQLLETDPVLMRRVVHRAILTEDFIAFQLAYDDDEMVLEFPMGMKVTVPDSYEPEQFAIYYKPNNSNILAKLDGKFMNDEKTEYQVVVYEPGTYILVNEISNILVTDIVVEEETLKLKPNRNYSLKPMVLPVNADNTNVTYWSSDEDIATVSENGKIKTFEEGTCEIWIEAQDESGVYKIIYVEVKYGK